MSPKRKDSLKEGANNQFTNKEADQDEENSSYRVSKSTRACDACKLSRIRCTPENGNCTKCNLMNKKCEFSVMPKKRGPKPKRHIRGEGYDSTGKGTIGTIVETQDNFIMEMVQNKPRIEPQPEYVEQKESANQPNYVSYPQMVKNYRSERPNSFVRPRSSSQIEPSQYVPVNSNDYDHQHPHWANNEGDRRRIHRHSIPEFSAIRQNQPPTYHRINLNIDYSETNDLNRRLPNLPNIYRSENRPKSSFDISELANFTPQTRPPPLPETFKIRSMSHMSPVSNPVVTVNPIIHSPINDIEAKLHRTMAIIRKYLGYVPSISYNHSPLSPPLPLDTKTIEYIELLFAVLGREQYKDRDSKSRNDIIACLNDIMIEYDQHAHNDEVSHSSQKFMDQHVYLVLISVAALGGALALNRDREGDYHALPQAFDVRYAFRRALNFNLSLTSSHRLDYDPIDGVENPYSHVSSSEMKFKKKKIDFANQLLWQARDFIQDTLPSYT